MDPEEVFGSLFGGERFNGASPLSLSHRFLDYTGTDGGGREQT